jgi:hypothetical protein
VRQFTLFAESKGGSQTGGRSSILARLPLSADGLTQCRRQDARSANVAAPPHALKISRVHPIDCLVNPQDLTDEEIWAIVLAMLPGLRDDARYLVHRDWIINSIRKLLEARATGDTLEELFARLTLAGEHELASWMRKWRQERRYGPIEHLEYF